MARFWLFGTLFAVLPIAASPPGDRLLSFVGIGSAALVANIVKPLVDAELRQRSSRASFAVASAFAACTWCSRRSYCRACRADAGARSRLGESHDMRSISARSRTANVVILNAPVDIFASYIQAERAWIGVPRAKRLYWLTSSGSPAVVCRSDARTLVIERENGFLSTPLETHYRRSESPMRAGTTVELAQMTATVKPQRMRAPLGRELSIRRSARVELLRVLHLERRSLPAFDIGRLTTTCGAAGRRSDEF